MRHAPHDALREDRPDGTVLLRARAPLARTARRTTDWVERWAAETPEAVMLAERSGPGWREVSYAEGRERARAMAVGLLGLGLGPGAPLLILSGNSVDHGLLALAAQYAGVPFVPLAEQYARIPEARHQIDHVAGAVRPGAVYAEDGGAFAEALARPSLAGARVLTSRGGPDGAVTLHDLARAGGDVSAAHDAVGPGTVAKILFTSGSTSAPKGVPTTHEMLCANQDQIAQALPFLRARPPRILDWLPWNHVFGGSHDVNMMLANGGALYVDGGRPAPQLIGTTLENMGLVSGTIAFNVPAGFALIRDALKRDAGLRRAYFADLDMLFYAGASLPQDVWADLEAMAREARGDMPLFTSSWGLTETAPAHLLQHRPIERSGVVGVPLPGAEVKLVPDAGDEGRYEVRVRGPNVFAGYLNGEAPFDEEGFFATGDAMRLEGDDPNMGLRFDGRLAEEFKLLTGTWVRAAALRLAALSALGDLASDVVVAGADRAEVGLLIVPSAALREGAEEAEGALIVDPAPIRAALAPIGTSSSTSIARALVMTEPPSFADGEATAKGNVNVRRLLTRRAALVERLYAGGLAAIVIGDAP